MRTSSDMMTALFFYDYIGFVAATLTTMAFVPQLVKAWKTKQTQDLSLGMVCLFVMGIFLWLIYGIYIISLPIILANSVTLILAVALLMLKLKYA